MKKFLVLYRDPIGARERMASVTPEQSKAGMDAWMSWANANRSAIVDLGSPVANTTGAGSEGVAIAGFSILQADSASAMDEILANHPHRVMPDASIEVLEFLPMPGM
jgi:hypothetical protein